MARSDATTVQQYLQELPEERREAIESVRSAILAALPEGYVEAMRWGMITYEVPLERFADTYNGQPLMYAALANQKGHMAVYLTSVFVDPDRLDRFREAYRASGKRLDMGKSCVRFSALDDLPLDVVADVIGSTTVEDFLSLHSAAKG